MEEENVKKMDLYFILSVSQDITLLVAVSVDHLYLTAED